MHHLMPGTIIINLDDTHLASAGRPAEAWTRYLLATPESRYVSQGWCVDAALFNGIDNLLSDTIILTRLKSNRPHAVTRTLQYNLPPRISLALKQQREMILDAALILSCFLPLRLLM